MRQARLLLAVAALSALGGCVTPPSATDPGKDAEILQRIAQYAERSSQSMQRLSALKAGHGGVQVVEVGTPPGMDVQVSINWSGPIDALVRKLGEMTGYAYTEPVGVKPATPVLVNVAVTNMSAFEILRDISAQAGSAAEVVVQPDSRRIFVRWAPATRSGGFVSSQK
jgi:hypothetical protein